VGRKRHKTSRRATRRDASAIPHVASRLRPLLGAVVAAVSTLSVVGLVLTRARTETKEARARSHEVPAARLVGSSTCATCHSTEAAEWRQSQHQAAMALASDGSVRGDFNHARFTYAGTTSEFFKRDGKFFVRTDGPDGKLADFEIRYTFGVEPLQQYLIEFADGRVQALSIAWDTRSKKFGGQRWFHLHPHERIGHDDELHWTRPSQNWNYMCADCHSTAIRKNYDAATNRFHSSWAEISVGCEACHGPGSRHVAWAAEARRNPRPRRDSTLGLVASLGERHGVTWNVSAVNGNATRSTPRTTEVEIGVCAQCHSRRTQIAEGYQPGKPFLDYYRPALLTRPTYFVDGQQRDEDYDWGSFLESRMYANGVTCSDCHNPHSGRLRAQGNAVCATCHLPTRYDTPAHHHHALADPAVACTSCHMPTATYMVIDSRHDHSFRVPRPDLSVELGTPNACTSCHVERDARWAAVQVRNWYGHDPQGFQRFAQTFAAADADSAGAQGKLRALARDMTQPSIARATSLAALSASASPEAVAVVAASLQDASVIVRLGALDASAQLAPDQRLQLVTPLLSDSIRAVRIAAVQLLAGAPLSRLSMDQRAAFESASNEYIETQRQNADRAEARANLGTFLAAIGNAAGGEVELRSAIRLDPRFVPAYINLADVYRGIGRDAEGERLLRAGLSRAPESAVLHYALGLVLTRMNRSDSALHEFARAASFEPGSARFAYAHALALNAAGRASAAIAVLEASVTQHPRDGDILSALVSFLNARGNIGKARRYADQLRLLARNP
jgi:tetratricopeptide (TPR) repeat protein/formate-dependent nitrite reductase cytochrome c552 subunit